MSKNIGSTDKTVRLTLGILFIVIALMPYLGMPATVGAWVWILLVIGAVLVITALIGFCPAYKIFGFSTLKDK